MVGSTGRRPAPGPQPLPLLVGCQADLRVQRGPCVSYSQAMAASRQLGAALYVETAASAQGHSSAYSAFEAAGLALLGHFPPTSRAGVAVRPEQRGTTEFWTRLGSPEPHRRLSRNISKSISLTNLSLVRTKSGSPLAGPSPHRALAATRSASCSPSGSQPNMITIKVFLININGYKFSGQQPHHQ